MLASNYCNKVATFNPSCLSLNPTSFKRPFSLWGLLSGTNNSTGHHHSGNGSSGSSNNSSFLRRRRRQRRHECWDEIETEEKGGPLGSLEYRMYFKSRTRPGEYISPWHSIPIFPGSGRGDGQYVVHMVCEVPRFTRHKMMISRTEPFNPIMQERVRSKQTGKLVPRYIKYSPMIYNYGAVPQTWADANTAEGGDNNPLDIIEISSKPARIGEVKRVRILGALPLIDSDEINWKLIAVDVASHEARGVRDLTDVERFMPGVVNSIREWFRVYKVAEGLPSNKYGFDNKNVNCEYTMRIINESHESWKSLSDSKRRKAMLPKESNEIAKTLLL